MNHDPFEWGRPSDAVYGAYNTSIANAAIPTSHTQQPIVTGTSVISMKYDNGIIMASDTLASYGSLLRFSGMDRIFPVGSSTVVGISGDISDMQYIERQLRDMEIENNYDNEYADAEEMLKPSYIFEYLACLMYQRRSKMNPLWNAIIVGGIEDGKQFLKYVDLKGVRYSSQSLATGFGSHMAIPLMRKLVDCDEDVQRVNKETARQAIIDCMKVLFFRDARSSKEFNLAVVDKDTGLNIEKISLDGMNWGFAKNIKGYGTQTV